MRFALVTLTITLLPACVAGPEAHLDDRTLSYGCSDTVVVGTVADSVDEPAEKTGNLLGDGWVSASLHVGEVVRGETLPPVLPVRYFAHTAIRQDQELMLVLKQTAGGYEIQSGQLMRERPVLVSRCR